MDHEGVTVHVHPDVVAVIELYGDLVGRGAVERTRFNQVHLLAERLAEGHQARHRGAFVELTNWHPALVGLSPDELWARTLDPPDCHLAVARQRGYDRVEEVVPDSIAPSAPFEAAVDGMLAGDIDAMASLLGEHPDLAGRTSHWPHHATLLHYATANGVETYRQVVPSNLPEMVSMLVDHGADVNAAAHAYGADLRPLGLLLSSAHPRNAGVIDEVAGILRAAGAS
ncbi:MAG TPA: hypothetical protein VNG12_11550 [Acidimicrobiales bacterium]|nr:hypothetical protein [Acidimicrobiales bacterium]